MQGITMNQPQDCPWGVTAPYAMATQPPAMHRMLDDGQRPNGARIPVRLRTLGRRTRPLRVGVLSPVLHLGGVELQLLALMRYCDRHKVAWSGVAVTETVDPQMVDLIGMYANVGIGALAVKGLIAQSDVILVWGNRNAAELLQGFRGKVVFVAHGVGDWTRSMAIGVESLASEIVCVSKAAKAALPPHLVASARVLVNGVDRSRVTITDPPQSSRVKWGIPAGVPVVGYVGRYSSEKNYLAAALTARMLDGHAIYLGRPCGIPDAEERIRLAAEGRVTLLPPWTHPGDVYAVMDCMVAASEEGFGLAIVEAWLAGVPVVTIPSGIASDLAGALPWVAEFVPPWANPEQLARATKRAIGCRYTGDCDRLRRYAERYLSAEAMAERWDRFFETL